MVYTPYANSVGRIMFFSSCDGQFVYSFTSCINLVYYSSDETTRIFSSLFSSCAVS